MRFQSIAAYNQPGLPPPVTSGGLQNFVDPNGITWIAKPGVYGGNWKQARDVLIGAVHRNAAFSLNTGPAVIGYDFIELDVYGLYVSASGSIIVPVAGVWRFEHQISIVGTGTGQWVGAQIQQNGNIVRNTTQHSSLAVWYSASNMISLKCSVNDNIQSLGNSSGPFTGQTGVMTYFQYEYMGTG